MNRKLVPLGLMLVASELATGHAHATDLSQVLESYLLIDMTYYPPPPAPPVTSFFRADEAGIDAIGGLNQAIASQVTSQPLGSSSAGLVYIFDPALGAPTRASQTSGSLFAERAATIGAKKWNFGVRYTSFRGASIDGLKLDSGNIAYNLQWIPGNPGVAGDLVQIRYHIDLDVSNVLFFGTSGPTDKSEVGILIPLAKVRMDMSVDESVFAFASGGGVLYFADGSVEQTVQSSDLASGFGDLLLRGKYRFWKHRKNMLSGALEIRVPTGDASNFLGTGVTQLTAGLIDSGEYGRWSPHLNLGYTASFGTSSATGADAPDEVRAALGCDVAVHSRVTLSLDFLERYFLDVTRVKIVQTQFPLDPGETLPQLTPYQGNAAVSRIGLGARFNPKGGSVISAGLLLSVGGQGLANDLAFVVGYDYTF